MKKIVAVFIASALLASCAAPKAYVATGGSRADGTVNLSYEYGRFQKPEVDESQGLAEAVSRCQVWGYQSASAFGGALESCVIANSSGQCGRWQVTKSYQCAGGN